MSTGAPLLAFFQIALAEAELRAGFYDKANLALQEGEKLLRLEPIWTSEILRLSGDLRMAEEPGDCSAVAQLYDQALTEARHHGAKSFELRAALSLARLHRRQGQETQAIDLVRPVFSWFTEGFDTADLQAVQKMFD